MGFEAISRVYRHRRHHLNKSVEEREIEGKGIRGCGWGGILSFLGKVCVIPASQSATRKPTRRKREDDRGAKKDGRECRIIDG